MTHHWRALAAEAGIAASQIELGATLLGRTVPQRTASYAAAFFPLSIGFERAAKVILQIDQKLANGNFSTEREMRRLGHDLVALLDQVEEMCARRYPGNGLLDRPSEVVHRNIVAILSSFAGKGRYFHLDHLGGAQAEGGDAASQWWEVVVADVARRHYSAARRRRDEQRAQSLQSMVQDAAFIRDNIVNGTTINSVEEAALANLLNDAVVPWCRMYVMQISRWLARVSIELGFDAIADPEVPYLADFFGPLNLSDEQLRRRKQWMSSAYK